MKNAQVIGNDEVGFGLKDIIVKLVDAFVASDFAGGGSTRKVEKMHAVDMSYRIKATTPNGRGARLR